MQKIKWGILSCANIAINKVIPAMKECEYAEILAIASRDIEKSKKIARDFSIPLSYGSYNELLECKEIDAIYIPLPNHMHLEWCIKAMEAGKHVLCEKPIVLSSEDVKKLIQVRDKTGMKISEAFMIRFHPQWLKVKELINNGEIGDLKVFQGFFSYYNKDKSNIRNIKEYGGGSLWDIGCYPINTSRFIFNSEPTRVVSILEKDPDFDTDILTSAILKYPLGQATFSSGTQLFPHQKVTILGSKNKIEIEIPFNAPTDREATILLDKTLVSSNICNQYTLQGDSFSKAILYNTDVLVPLEDSLKNSKVIEAIFKSGKSGKWELV